MRGEKNEVALFVFWLVLAATVVIVSDSLKSTPEGRELWQRFVAIEH